MKKYIIILVILIIFIIGCTKKTIGQDSLFGEFVIHSQEHYNTLLLDYNDFKKTSINNFKPQIDFSNENFSVLRNKYELDKIAGNDSDLSKALNIFFWVCENTQHRGDYLNHIPQNSLDLLEYSFGRGYEGALNCLNLSYILTECLISIGLPAHTVRILPFSYKDTDNHVVTHVYIKNLNKWIMLDPTWSNYFCDINGNILDLMEIRNMFINNQEIYLNDEFSYNGKLLITDHEYIQWFKRYISKNLFYFELNEISTFGQDNTGKKLYVSPVNFDPVENSNKNAQYRLDILKSSEEKAIELYGQSAIDNYKKYMYDLLEKNINEKEYDTYIYLSPEDFLKK